MKNGKKRKVDPEKTSVDYSFDLRKEFEWSGELLCYFHNSKNNGHPVRQFRSSSSIIICAKISETDSSKIKIGDEIKIEITAQNDQFENDHIGLIHKYRQTIEMYVWLNWDYIHHIHCILLSKKAEMLSITGTELFNRSGKIKGILIQQQYEPYGSR